MKRWARRFNFRTKLLLVGLAGLVPLLIITGLVLGEKQQAIDLGARQLAGLHQAQNLETLLLPLGMHEVWDAARTVAAAPVTGGGAGAASGALDIAGNLRAAGLDVDRALSLQDAQSEDYGAPAAENARRWNEIKTAWRGLNAKSGASLSELERLHTELRRRILAYRDYIADTSGLTLDGNPQVNFAIDAAVLGLPDFENDVAEMRSHAASVTLSALSRSTKGDFEQILHSQILAEGALERIAVDMHRAAQGDAAGAEWRDAAQAALGRLNTDFDVWSLDIKQNVTGGGVSEPLDSMLRNASRLLPAIAELRERMQQAATVQLELKLTQLRTQRTVMILLVTLALLIALAIMALIGASTVGEMGEVVAMVSRLAEGDYTRVIEATGTDELGRITLALRRMQDKLSEVLHGVKQSALTVATAARQISAGTQDLSSRTELQAANLEQTASAMEHMTSTVKQNADNAKLANTLAQAARDQAENGGVIVEQTVAAMGAIDVSSKRIADIITVIDEIAFQTNLLALNAAVEAARAGDQGRGFAVVASEVRNLAQRSASAAKEIKELITDSVSKVGEGSRLVSESGRRLGEIVVAVKKVSDVVGEISNASQEQAASAEQISRAVTQMDQSTQQNAAMVEQANAAAASMSDQAVRLAEVTAFFQFNGDGFPGAAATPPPLAAPRAVEPARAAVLSRPPGAQPVAPALQPVASARQVERRAPGRPWAGATPVPQQASGAAPAAPSNEWSEF